MGYLQKNLGIAQAEDEATLNDINARLSSHLQPHKDSNGFRKLILILSESGTQSHNSYSVLQATLVLFQLWMAVLSVHCPAD